MVPLVLLPVAVTLGATYWAGASKRRQIIRAARRVVPLKREHAIHKVVSQGRAFGKKYSGCGDLWNYVLDVIGAPNEWVNRDSLRRGTKWKPAVNISKPWGAAHAAGAAIRFKKGGPLPKAGDLVLIGKEPEEIAHVLVILKRIGPRKFRTAEYGGGSNAGTIGTRTWSEDGRTIGDKLGERHLVGWIDADKIPIDPRLKPGAVRSLLHLAKPERQAA